MSSITRQDTSGSVSFLKMRGPVRLPMETFAIERHPGVAGYAIWKMGAAANAFTVITFVDVLNAAALSTAKQTYAAFVGKYCTIVDDHGTSWTNYVCLGTEPLSENSVALFQGGVNANPAKALVTLWQFLYPWGS